MLAIEEVVIFPVCVFFFAFILGCCLSNALKKYKNILRNGAKYVNDKKVPHPRGDVRAIMLQATVNNWRECGSLRVRFFGQRAFDDAHHSIPTPVRCPEVNWIPCSGFQLTYFKAVRNRNPARVPSEDSQSAIYSFAYYILPPGEGRVPTTHWPHSRGFCKLDSCWNWHRMDCVCVK